MSEKLQAIARFMDAGGAPLWSEWQDMDVETQASFVAVARKRRVEQALRIGKATTGDRGMLEVVAELDAGEALEAALLRMAVTDAAG